MSWDSVQRDNNDDNNGVTGTQEVQDYYDNNGDNSNGTYDDTKSQSQDAGLSPDSSESSSSSESKENNNKKNKKVVALLSGGLDSRLAVKMMKEQGFDVTAVGIKTPFCDFDCGRGCGFEIRKTADELDVDLKTVYLGEEYLEMLKNPKYGYGSGMNPCIDCRAMMFRAARKYMDELGADFMISGEVLGQRPMSQHAPALRAVEKEAGLEGKIVRPLSAGLLPQTEPEKDGLIKKEDLGKIKGRSRKKQLEMAKDFEIDDPPNAGGGCLLTDPAFSRKAKDLFGHKRNPTINDVDLLKIGRHFRFDEKTKFVVGRNEDENNVIESLASENDVLMWAKDAKGPTSIVRGQNSEQYLRLAASVTLRYSDAPKDTEGEVVIRHLKDQSHYKGDNNKNGNDGNNNDNSQASDGDLASQQQPQQDYTVAVMPAAEPEYSSYRIE